MAKQDNKCEANFTTSRPSTTDETKTDIKEDIRDSGIVSHLFLTLSVVFVAAGWYYMFASK